MSTTLLARWDTRRTEVFPKLGHIHAALTDTTLDVAWLEESLRSLDSALDLLGIVGGVGIAPDIAQWRAGNAPAIARLRKPADIKRGLPHPIRILCAWQPSSRIRDHSARHIFRPVCPQPGGRIERRSLISLANCLIRSCPLR
jgi:hypothetical protein